jgi:hypothetical protein
VGSPHAIRRGGRVFRGSAARGRTFLVLLGMAAAAAGGALSALPPTVSVELDASGYHLGAVRLAPQGDGVYAGPGGAVVLARGARGTEAGGSTYLDGRHMVGVCRPADRGTAEHCSFTLDGRRVEADDRLRDGGWERTYSDGRRARIELPGGRPVPVPFALGR